MACKKEILTQRRKGRGDFRREEGQMAKGKSTKNSRKLTGTKKRLTVKEMLAIGRRIRKSIKGPLIDHAEFLYDENGLTK